eukprot:gene17371-20725_t
MSIIEDVDSSSSTTTTTTTTKNDAIIVNGSDSSISVPTEPKKPPPHLISMISIMAIGFIANIEYGIVMPSALHYIQSLKGNDMMFGWAISGFSLAQLIFLPLIGMWADRRTLREAICVTLMIGMIGNLVYANAVSPIMVVMGRVIAGIGSSNMALTNSYIADVTTQEDRTRYMAKVNGINAFGLVAGPVFNLALNKINFSFHMGRMHVIFDTLRNPGWMLALSLFLCLSSFVFFQEPDRQSLKQKKIAAAKTINDERAPLLSGDVSAMSIDENPSPKSLNSSIAQISSSMHYSYSKYSSAKSHKAIDGGAMSYREETFWDKVKKLLNASLLTCFAINFVQNFVFGTLETIITPITQNQYKFTTIDNSITYSVVSAEIIVFIFATVAASNFGAQDKYLILFGQVFLGGGLTLLLVFFGLTPIATHVPFWKFCLAVGITTVGIPTQNTSIYSLYSKLLNRIYGEDASQGFETGVLMLVGSAARIVGPLWGSYGTGSTMSNMFPLFIVLLAIWVFDMGVTLIFFGKLTFITKPGQSAGMNFGH